MSLNRHAHRGQTSTSRRSNQFWPFLEVLERRELLSASLPVTLSIQPWGGRGFPEIMNAGPGNVPHGSHEISPQTAQDRLRHFYAHGFVCTSSDELNDLHRNLIGPIKNQPERGQAEDLFYSRVLIFSSLGMFITPQQVLAGELPDSNMLAHGPLGTTFVPKSLVEEIAKNQAAELAGEVKNVGTELAPRWVPTKPLSQAEVNAAHASEEVKKQGLAEHSVLEIKATANPLTQLAQPKSAQMVSQVSVSQQLPWSALTQALDVGAAATGALESTIDIIARARIVANFRQATPLIGSTRVKEITNAAFKFDKSFSDLAKVLGPGAKSSVGVLAKAKAATKVLATAGVVLDATRVVVDTVQAFKSEGIPKAGATAAVGSVQIALAMKVATLGAAAGAALATTALGTALGIAIAPAAVVGGVGAGLVYFGMTRSPLGQKITNWTIGSVAGVIERAGSR